MDPRFDYIIVGAGTAGCLLANRLSVDPSIRVLLLEAGGRDNYMWIYIPIGYLYCVGNPRTDWLYKTEAEEGLGGRAIGYPRGKVLGGCSSISGMIDMRGQRGDYHAWARENPAWSWNELLPYFRKHEDWHGLDAGGSDALHGHDGEWRVEKQRVGWKLLDAFQRAATQVGIPATENFNRGDNLGCGYFEVSRRRGVRWNAARAFLRPVLSRPNLKVMTGALVARLRSDNGSGRIRGVECRVGSQSTQNQRFLCSGEVIVSAGAIGGVRILQSSGIDPAEVLRNAGVQPLVDLGGVAENLQDHLQLRMIYRVSKARSLNLQANSLFGKAQMGRQYANLEYHVQPLPLDRFGEPLHRFRAFTASACHLHPASRGLVRIAFADPFEAPKMRPNNLAAEIDRKVAADAIRLTRKIVSADEFRQYFPVEYLPGVKFQTDEELEQAASQIGTTIFHPVGTCRMGPSIDSLAVVDHRLRCRRVPGLRVVDASTMPTITAGSTNAPTLMIAEKGAEMILADRRSA